MKSKEQQKRDEDWSSLANQVVGGEDMHTMFPTAKHRAAEELHAVTAERDQLKQQLAAKTREALEANDTLAERDLQMVYVINSLEDIKEDDAAFDLATRILSKLPTVAKQVEDRSYLEPLAKVEELLGDIRVSIQTDEMDLAIQEIDKAETIVRKLREGKL